MSKLRPNIQGLVELLDDLALDDDLVRDEVAAMDLDVEAWATEMHAKEEATATAERARAYEAAQTAYREEAARFAQRAREPRRDKTAQLAVLRALVARAPAAVAVHFHKFESASEDELAAMIAKLRYLLDHESDE